MEMLADMCSRLVERTLKIKDLYIVPWSRDQVIGELITSPGIVIDSPVSQVKLEAGIGRGTAWWEFSVAWITKIYPPGL